MALKKDLDDMSGKEKLRYELDKLKGMNFKAKCGYIWAYYKIVFAAIIAIIVIANIGWTMYKNSKIENVLYIAAMDTSLNVDENTVMEDFEKYIQLDDVFQTITLDTTLVSESLDASYEMSSNVKLTTLLAAREIDLLVMGEQSSGDYMEQGLFADLREVLPEELRAKVEPYLVEGRLAESGETIAYGIDLEENEIMSSEAYFYGETAILSIVSNTKHLDMAISFIEYLFL